MNAFRIQLMLMSISIVLAVGAPTPASAVSLPTEGPWWSVGGSLPPQGVTKAVISGKVVGGMDLYGKFVTKFIRIACTTGESKGSIFNGSQQAEGENTLTLSKCVVEESSSMKGTYKEIKGCSTQSEIKTNTIKSTGWYLSNISRTRTASAAFLNSPSSGAVVATIEFIGEGCALIEGIFKVEGDVASDFTPENTEAAKGTARFSSEQQLHLWRPTTEAKFTEIQLSLSFDHTEAQLQGGVEVELGSKEKLGVASGFVCGPGNPDMSWYIDYPACSMMSVNRRGDYERFPNF
jgi:hypothetical protein